MWYLWEYEANNCDKCEVWFSHQRLTPTTTRPPWSPLPPNLTSPATTCYFARFILQWSLWFWIMIVAFCLNFYFTFNLFATLHCYHLLRCTFYTLTIEDCDYCGLWLWPSVLIFTSNYLPHCYHLVLCTFYTMTIADCDGNDGWGSKPWLRSISLLKCRHTTLLVQLFD